ncbi:WEB family protein At3g13190 isoform X1 [Brassica napus]|uniref:WEB family protein At3g13190 isoform X1 n=1 Tax=Brassica napus TaxID=3708 RepID=UPI0020790AA1|nr:WEB family protein At3g13190 isoform X1 [Brassica napus]
MVLIYLRNKESVFSIQGVAKLVGSVFLLGVNGYYSFCSTCSEALQRWFIWWRRTSQPEETNLCLWNQEVDKLKEKIKSAEMAKIEALLELDEAKKTVEHLNHKLRNDEKGLALSSISSNVRDVSSELGIAKELLQRVVAEEESRQDLDVSSSNNVIVVTSELGFAKESLHRAAEEESGLCMLIESLKLELENVKEEHSELKEKEQRETEQAVEELKKEAEDAKRELLQLEEELKITLKEAKEAKAVEECLNVQESCGGGGGGLTETEALRACRDETLKKLEMSEKEIEDIKAATQEALKNAEMAEEATIVMDAELKRRRKAASRMWAKSFPSAKEVDKSKSRSKETCLVKC